MKFLRSFLLGRFRTLGLLSDITMVGAAALRVVRRPSDRNAPRIKAGELVLVGAAALRLLRRIRRVRRNRRQLASVD